MATTNAHDQDEAERMKARLESESARAMIKTVKAEDFVPVPNVSVDEGRHKYVLISAVRPEFIESDDDTNDTNNNSSRNEEELFVVSKRGAKYHRNAAEPFIYKLEEAGYSHISVKGGGRIYLNSESQIMEIYGYSYGFGKADHHISQRVVETDERFYNYNVSWSDEGY